VAENLNDNIRGAKDLGSVTGHLCAFSGVLGVGIAGFKSSILFHHNIEAGFLEVRNDRRYERDATFAGIAFARDANSHSFIPRPTGSGLPFPRRVEELSIRMGAV
jgi:hypothetical protein